MSNYDDDIFNQSDDDLFQETSQVSQNISDHLKSVHGIDVDISDIDIDNPDSNIIRAKICIAFNEASGNWITNAHAAAFTRTNQQLLDQITDGLYSKMNYYYLIEGKIMLRRVIIELLTSLKNVDSNDVKFLRDTFKINTDYIFIDVYINHLLSMMKYFNDRYTTMYLALAKDLGLEPDPSIADSNDDIVELPYLQRKHARNSHIQYVTEDYLSNVLSNFTKD